MDAELEKDIEDMLYYKDVIYYEAERIVHLLSGSLLNKKYELDSGKITKEEYDNFLDKSLFPDKSKEIVNLIQREIAKARLEEIENIRGLDLLGTLERIEKTHNFIEHRKRLIEALPPNINDQAKVYDIRRGKQ